MVKKAKYFQRRVFDVSPDRASCDRLREIVEALGIKRVGGPVLSVAKLPILQIDVYEIMDNKNTERSGMIRIVSGNGINHISIEEEFSKFIRDELNRYGIEHKSRKVRIGSYKEIGNLEI